MARPAGDSIKVAWTGTGTGTMSLGAAIAGFQAFPAALNGQPISYAIENDAGTERENGIGTYTAAGTTLTRDLVTFSTAGAPTKQSFSAGTKHVRVVPLAHDLVPNHATTNPTATDDITQGYIAGRSRWLNTTTKQLFECVDHSAANAVWAVVQYTDDGGIINLAAVDLSRTNGYDDLVLFAPVELALSGATHVAGATATARVTGNDHAVTVDNVTVFWADGTVGGKSWSDQRTLALWFHPSLGVALAFVPSDGSGSGSGGTWTAGITFNPTACAFDVNRTYQPLTISANEQFSLDGAVTPVNGAAILVTVTFSGNPMLTWDAAFVAATDDLNGSLPTAVDDGTYALRFTYGAIGAAGVGRVRVEGFPVEPAAHTHELADITGPALLTDDEETASFTLALTHADQKMVRCNHASTPIVVTVPPNSSVAIPVHTIISFVQWGAATVSFNQGSGVTILPGDDYLIDTRYGVASLWQQSLNTWLLYGNIEAA